MRAPYSEVPIPDAIPGEHRPVANAFVRKGDADLERFVSVEVKAVSNQQALLDLGMVFDGNVAFKRVGGDSRYKLFKDLHAFELLLAQTLNAMGVAVRFQ
jgi:hypothetical protein